MATTRKILSKGIIKKVEAPQSGEKSTELENEPKRENTNIENQKTEQGREESKSEAPRLKKSCQFCTNKTEPHYYDIVALKRFINDRGRIVTRVRSGACSKHQRRITKEIKRARHLALLSFTVKV